MQKPIMVDAYSGARVLASVSLTRDPTLSKPSHLLLPVFIPVTLFSSGISVALERGK